MSAESAVQDSGDAARVQSDCGCDFAVVAAGGCEPDDFQMPHGNLHGALMAEVCAPVVIDGCDRQVGVARRGFLGGAEVQSGCEVLCDAIRAFECLEDA
jgi:hypothetical protein